MNKNGIYNKYIYILSFLLIGLNISGYFINPLNKYENLAMNNYYDKNYPSGYLYDDINIDYLKQIYNKEIPNLTVEAINDEIFTSIRHSDLRKVEIYENWLIFTLGKIYEPISRTQNPYRIINGGVGECAEQVAILNYISNQYGWASRFIGLNEHVISEIKTESGWVVADPHYGVYFDMSFEELQNTEKEDIFKILNEKGYGIEFSDWYIRVMRTEEDNKILEVGEAISPRLDMFEKFSDILKWIFPVLLLFLTQISYRKS
tara:strand:+ start:406 stop:1188 length:783 start_codon:yes stop_codon:yes gene_type:complete